MPLEPAALSAYGSRSTQPSPVNRMMSAFAADFRPDRDVNLGVGYVNERTIPRLPIQQALHAVLADPARYKAALNYGGPQGSDNLIAALRRFLQRTSFATAPDALHRQQIIIGPSGATSLLEALAQVLAPGIVITTDPMYYIYCDVLERIGHRVVAIAEDTEGLQPALLGQLVEQGAVPLEQLSCVYAVTVNNPTGTIMTNQRRRQLALTVARLSRQAGRQIPLIIDRAYDDLVHDPAVEPLHSCLIDPPTDCLIYEVGTLSKVLSPALRIGYLLGPDTPLLQALIQKTSDTGFSAPLITQEMAGWLLDQHIETQLASVNRGYREKSRAVGTWIETYLGDLLDDCRGGQAGFYYYLTLSDIDTREGSPFFRYLVRATGDPAIDGPPDARQPRVLYIPGQYCVHPAGQLAAIGQRQMRISYGFEEPDRLQLAIRLMRDAAGWARRQR